MTKHRHKKQGMEHPKKLVRLRKRAKEVTVSHPPEVQDLSELSGKQARRLAHKLQTYQIELEALNDKLLRAQGELAQARDNYADLYDRAPVSYLTVAESGHIQRANLTAAALLGVVRSSLLHMPLAKFVIQEELGLFNKHHKQVLTKAGRRARQVCELRMVRADGSEFFSHMESVSQEDVKGTITGYRATLTDITPLKRTELELRDREARIKAVLDVAVDGIFTVHQNDAIESVNPGGHHMFGYPEGKLLGRDILTLIPDIYEVLNDAGRDRSQQTEMAAVAPTLRELVGQRRDGTNFPIEVTLRDICMEKETQMVIFVRDISERKQIEEMRRSFFAIASHELRTPLNNMVLSLDMLAKGEAGVLPPYLTDMIEVARRGGARLRRLIHDILDMQKIEAGRVGFRLDILDLVPLVEEAIKSAAVYAEQFGVRYVLESGATGIKIAAESDRFHQILDNLLSNAARFSPTDGTVHIVLSRENDMVRVAVTDHGPGVPEEFRPLVFEPFAQAAPSLEDSRNRDSAGLGLSIVKAIVEKLGGRIGFDSKPGVVTTFYVVLPEWRGDLYQ